VNKKPTTGPLAIHVKYVLDAYVKAMGINDLYILGRKEKVEGERKDIWRSWMFFKE